ncbi:MAG: hypothetical protein P0Y55_10370 [Candidatus Cohnella colombiensis]|uniref:Uncharacterized protein n=1 Tax=Candidatus Cohnella colombiensis TaxID=3121368 RepID=A0AA95JAH4_9BACL|nr:MAG: hypothetical protein P0Y55_10370 [Cohnella sp.]
MRKIRWTVLFTLVLLQVVSRAGALHPVYAEPLPDETKKLLEQGLSLVELDREIERISNLQVQTEASIRASEQQLHKQELAITVQQEKADRVLRSYYMGYKDFLLNALLSANSLSQLLEVWDTMDLILESDHQTMNNYGEQYRAIKQGYEELKQHKDDLADVGSQLIKQRERLVALQREIDLALSQSGQEMMLLRLMEELQAYWRNVGLFEVKQHFKALAGAMNELPEWIKETPGIVQSTGLKTKITITDKQLNEFVRSKDSRFNDFNFTFQDGLLTMEGDNGNIQVKIQGHYTIEEAPENAMLFHVDLLQFNGLTLPDTTRAELEREFDLGFYPQKLIKFIKAKSVSIEDGTLTVLLSLG